MLKVAHEQLEKMRADAAGRYPQEACGLVAGVEGRALEVFAVSNVLNSPVRFRMDPQEQWQVFKEVDERSWELLAIYHSHPSGPAGLSATDIDEAYYPDVIHIVWFKEAGEWIYRAFTLQSGIPSEIRLELVSTNDR